MEVAVHPHFGEHGPGGLVQGTQVAAGFRFLFGFRTVRRFRLALTRVEGPGDSRGQEIDEDRLGDEDAALCDRAGSGVTAAEVG